MREYKNKSADIKIYSFIDEYDKLEDLFNLDFSDFSLMLALKGLMEDKKYDLNHKDGKGKEHTFSRTTYDRAETDFDANFGLLTILDNTHLSYDTVINSIAFEKTSINDKAFSKMQNVSTYYGYLISGIDSLYKEFLQYGSNFDQIATAIHDFLEQDFDIDMSIIEDLFLEETENKND